MVNEKMQKKYNISIPDWFWDDDRNVIVAVNLLNHVIKKQKNHKNLTITYKDLANITDCGLTARTIDRFLGNISDVCKYNGIPYISGIVINAESLMPGVGYYKYFYGIKENDLAAQIKQFKEDYRNISRYGYWSKLLKELDI